MRSRPQHFDSKVTAIEESKDLNSLRVDDLVGSLITYESRRFQPRPTAKIFKAQEKDDEIVKIKEKAKESNTLGVLCQVRQITQVSQQDLCT